MTLKNMQSCSPDRSLHAVFEAYGEKLRQVEIRIKELLRSKVPFIPLIGDYVISSGGKRLRPLFHLISADLCGYDGDATVEIASIIELIHTASLLHDDVVDVAEMRRGKHPANAVWGNKAAVLVGDFLFSCAMRTAVLQQNNSIMEALSAGTTKMAEGEILQLIKIGDPKITEPEYLDIISAKTGRLISAACRIGAILGGLPGKKQNALGSFGLKTGMVFQMADDILDYMAEEEELGKKLCKDLADGKITLPLLLLLNTADEKDNAEARKIIKNFSQNDIPSVMSFLKKYRSIDASFVKAKTLIEEAKAEIDDFPASPAKKALFAIADYSIYREQ